MDDFQSKFDSKKQQPIIPEDESFESLITIAQKEKSKKTPKNESLLEKAEID